MGVARKVKPDVDKGITAQGRYVIAADGTAYGFNNNRDSERLLALLSKGETQFNAQVPAKVEIPGDLLDDKYGRFPEADTTVVRIFSRIRPLPADAHPSNRNVGRDHLWILKDEATDLARGRFPDSLALRLCRFQIYDNVRGEPDAWALDEIKVRNFRVEQGKLFGDFKMETADGQRGIEGTLEGALLLKAGRLDLRAYVTATAFGRSTYTPNPPAGKFPIVFAMETVNDATSRVVPPQWVGAGREYLGR